MTCCIVANNQRVMARALPLPKKHITYSFILCVHPDDLWVTYMRCFHKDIKKTFLKHSKYMNGPLHICYEEHDEIDESRCECCQKPFAVRGVLTKHVLYSLLPKEEIYVPVDTWHHAYMKSQMMELLYIVRMLGASNVNLRLEKKDTKSSDLDLEGNIAVPLATALNAEVGIKHNTMKASDNLIDLEATYDTDNASFTPYKSLGDFADDDNVFYLNEMQDWQDIVIQRTECNVKTLKFTFSISHNIRVQDAFFVKAHRMGVKLAASNQEQGTYYVSGVITWD
jgi:hypothetical protein